MISFKEYLTESRVAPLYHATSLERAKNIIKSNTLRSGKPEHSWIHGFTASDETMKKYISLTRNIRTAKQFILNYHSEETGHVIFQIDQRKIANRYKISPFQFWTNPKKSTAVTRIRDRNEDEERVFTDKIKDFMYYVTQIYTNDVEGIKSILDKKYHKLVKSYGFF